MNIRSLIRKIIKEQLSSSFDLHSKKNEDKAYEMMTWFESSGKYNVSFDTETPIGENDSYVVVLGYVDEGLMTRFKVIDVLSEEDITDKVPSEIKKRFEDRLIEQLEGQERERAYYLKDREDEEMKKEE